MAGGVEIRAVGGGLMAISQNKGGFLKGMDDVVGYCRLNQANEI